MPRRPTLPIHALLAALLAAAGCSDPHAHAVDRAAPGAPHDPGDPGELGDPGEASPAGAERSERPRGRARIRYDLDAHLARAELRQGQSLVVDLGAPGGAKYTLGGWRTRTGHTHDFDGTTTAVLGGVTGHLLVPGDREGEQVLRMRARALGRDPRITFYIDEHTIGHATLPSDGSFGVVEVTLPAERFHRGENMLQVRVPSTGSIPGLRTAGLAIDWLRVGPREDAHAQEGPPAPEALGRARGGEGLAIPQGWRLGYALEVPEGAHLRGRVRVEGEARLTAVVERDGEEPSALPVQPGADGRIDLSLARFAGAIVRLDLGAEGGAVSLLEPEVVTFDGAAPSRLAHRPRNVLIYLTDTLRADHLRPYAPSTRVRTPGLDAWARQAAVFLAGHSQENWTKPSVATLLSGLLPWQHNATTEQGSVPNSVELISETLRGDGFYTGAFIANGFVSDHFGFRQGFDTFRNYIREGRRTQARFVAADVLEWLDHRPADRPFFLYVHTVDPHVPYIPPPEALRLYDPNPYSGIVDFNRDRELLEKVKSGQIRLNDRDREHLTALYDGEITYHDAHFASVIQALERRGLADDTIVIFTADHGEELFDHGSVGHGHSVYEELIRVPLIVRIPGLAEGMRPSEPVGLVDVVPTVLEALGRPVPADLPGRSFLPLLEGESPSAPRAAVTGFMEGWRTVVVGRHKLIQRTASRSYLYDLGRDPGEQRDLASERPIALRYLRGMLGLTLAGVTGPRHRAEEAEIDATTRRQLEALGYTGTMAAPH